MGPTTTREEDLRDLPLADAGELRAFLDKRRWFEDKLKLLESAVPIYPFIHYEIDASATVQHRQAIRRLGEEASQYKLPTASQIKLWQDERDELEEEVLAFDGGDLGRMKEMTRAATLLPLTPPSTHLVSITLDLIVLVDRLLSMLRQRGELLDLSLTRLQWDELRWKMMVETKSIQQEIARVVKEKCAWMPGKSILPQTPRETPRTVPSSPATPSRSNRNSATVDDDTTMSSPPTLRTPRHQRTPKQYSTPTSKSLKLAILHSHIVALHARHQSLRTVLQVRTEALLDRMIDLAAPLKHLGGVDEPLNGEDADGGAVPDQLLDAQDELDNEVAELASDVEWCKELEAECQEAEEQYAKHAGVQMAVDGLLGYLRQMIVDGRVEDAALEELHARQAAVDQLEDDDDTLGRVSNGRFPENDRHNEQLSLHLIEGRRLAEMIWKRWTEGLAWYSKLLTSKQSLQDFTVKLSACSVEMQSTIDGFSPLSSNFSEYGEDGSSSLSFQPRATDTDTWLADAEAMTERATTLGQHVALQIMRSRAVSKGPPLFLRDEVELPDDGNIAEANSRAEMVMTLSQQLAGLVHLRKREKDMTPLVVRFAETVKQLDTAMSPTADDLGSEIKKTLYTGDPSPYRTADDLERIRAAVENLMSLGDQAVRLWREVEPVLPSEDLWAELLASLELRFREVCARLSDLQSSYRLYERVVAQTSIVRQVEQEAADLLAELGSVRKSKSPEATKPDEGILNPVSENHRHEHIQELCLRVREWESTLASRVSFLSTTPGDGEAEEISDDTAVDTSSRRSSGASSNVRHAGESLDECGVPDADLNLRAVDELVRRTVNTLAARVRGALAELVRHNDLNNQSVNSVEADTQPNDPIPDSPASTETRQERLAGATMTLNTTASPSAPSASTSRIPRLSLASSTSSSPRPISPSLGKSSIKRILRPRTASAPLREEDASLGSRPRASMPLSHAGSLSNHRVEAMPTSLARGTERASTPGSDKRSSALRRSTRMSLSSLTPVKSSSRKSVDRPTVKRKEYVPDMNNQLDVAVGKIVNDLKVDIPVVPVGPPSDPSTSRETTGPEQDQWKDLSGRYWIGSEGRAKLCFCRILRSKTVMVRVGGGWTELSKFLLDHFAETVASFRPFDADTGVLDLPASAPVTATESLLNPHADDQPDRPEGGDQPAQVAVGATPARAPLTSRRPNATPSSTSLDKTNSASSLRTTSQRHETPTRAHQASLTTHNHHASPSPSKLPSSSPSGVGSPLLPLQFIRRASDSHPVREKEKDRFGARRSVLGREGGGGMSRSSSGVTDREAGGGMSRSGSGLTE